MIDIINIIDIGLFALVDQIPYSFWFAFSASNQVLKLTAKTEHRARDPAVTEEVINARLLKLAGFLKLDFAKLRDQYFDHLPIAQHQFDKQTVSSFTAWRLAILSVTTGGRCSRKTKAHPVDELVKVLIRDGSMGCSTSGVERLFSLTKDCHNAQRADLDDTLVNDECFLLSIRQQDAVADKELASAAVEVWKRVYETARAAAVPGP